MASSPTLDQFLDSSAQQDPALEALVPIVRGIAEAGISLSDLISRHGLIDYLDQAGDENSDGDLQTPLDIMAHNIFEAALRQLPVSYLASEEEVEILEIDSRATYGVAIDPLDGSSNIETNMSIGTIFSILSGGAEDLVGQDLGSRQKAAGFLVYGPQTRLVLTCGAGSFIFLLEPDTQKFYIRRTTVSGTTAYGNSSTTVSPVRMAHWVKISTCAGTHHWLPRPTVS
jgi:fructose-1,6-bisphosphatase I